MNITAWVEPLATTRQYQSWGFVTYAYVYRFWDANERLIYIGSTNQPDERFKAHRRGSWWFDQVEHVTLARFENYSDAAKAKAQAIRTESPRWNVQHLYAADRSDFSAQRYADLIVTSLRNGHSAARRAELHAEYVARFPEHAAAFTYAP